MQLLIVRALALMPVMIDFAAASRADCYRIASERVLGSKRREFRSANVKLSLAVEISKTSLHIV